MESKVDEFLFASRNQKAVNLIACDMEGADVQNIEFLLKYVFSTNNKTKKMFVYDLFSETHFFEQTGTFNAFLKIPFKNQYIMNITLTILLESAILIFNQTAFVV